MKLLITCLLLLRVTTCYSQAVNQLNKDASKFKDRPIYILKLSKFSKLQVSDFIIDTNNIDSINVDKSPGTADLFSKNGVIVVVLKREAQLVNFNELLSIFKIPSAEKKLPVFIDSAISHRPKNNYFELTAIKFVKVEREKDTKMKYVSIRSIYAIHHLKKGEVYIK